MASAIEEKNSRDEKNSENERIHVFFQLTCAPNEVESMAKEIALEQTVEVPESIIKSQDILDNIVGRIESIEPIHAAQPAFRVDISYGAALSGYQIPQFLNLIFGNISIKNHMKIIGIELPDALVNKFHGPNFGIDGIRAILGVYGRPLLATAIKPKGSTVDQFANIAYAFCLGGGDIVKDDHNLTDESFEAFQSRVMRCHEAVEKANQETGRNGLYFPNIMAPMEDAERQAEFVLANGIKGILISPFAIGMDFTRYLSERYPLIFMAHPSFSGTLFHDPLHGIEPGTMLGQIFRMLGADISVYPNYGGRFGFSKEDCDNINFHLRGKMGGLKNAFPAPAGGMKYENLESMTKEYGEETAFLIGGALLSHSDSLTESTKAFMAKIKETFDERLETPQPDLASACVFESACELPAAGGAAALLKHLAFESGAFESGAFSWQGRPAEEYKASDEFPFQGIKRVELIGKQGEKSAFDLRYFEIEPGGYSSLEKHVHTHTVICMRGEGALIREGEKTVLKGHDIAYIEPLEVHQLKNETNEPFGFFCIVDHERDRPMKP